MSLTNAWRKEIKIVNATNKNIRDIIRVEVGRKENEESVVCSVPCSLCPRAYCEESVRGMDKWLYEHGADIRAHRISNSLTIHVQDYGHVLR